MFPLKVVTSVAVPYLPPSPTCCKKIDIKGEDNYHLNIMWQVSRRTE